MLEKLDKISLYLAIAIFGYLGYKMIVQSAESMEPQEKMPAITKKMLEPEFLVPSDNASPVSRDPFYVEWASYYDFAELTGNFSEAQQMSPDTPVPVFTKKLMGILTSGNSKNAALIDGKVYETGSLIDGSNPEKCWRIKAIRKHEVVIEFRNNTEILKINVDENIKEQESDN